MECKRNSGVGEFYGEAHYISFPGRFLCLLSVMLLFCCTSEGGQVQSKGTLYLRAFADKSGPVRNTGLMVAQATLDYLRELNERGGAGGYRVELLGDVEDMAYDPAQAVALYERWRTEPRWDEVVAVLGFGTNDTVALRDYIQADQMPLLIATFAGSTSSPVPVQRTLTLPSGAQVDVATPGYPTVFTMATDYTTQGRVMVDVAIGMGVGSRPAFLSPMDLATLETVGYGFELAAESRGRVADIVPFTFLSPTGAVTALQDYWANGGQATFVFVGGVHGHVNSVAELVSNTPSQDVSVFAVNLAFDEALRDSCVACRGRTVGMTGLAAYGDTRFEGMQEVVGLNQRSRALDQQDIAQFENMSYVYGYIRMGVLAAAITALSDADQPITRASLVQAIEDLPIQQFGGVTVPLDWTSEDHRPSMTVYAYSIGNDGLFSWEGQFSVVRNQSEVGW